MRLLCTLTEACNGEHRRGGVWEIQTHWVTKSELVEEDAVVEAGGGEDEAEVGGGEGAAEEGGNSRVALAYLGAG
jgi:hypothetical protein